VKDGSPTEAASFQREQARRQRLGLSPLKMSMLVANAMQRRVEGA